MPFLRLFRFYYQTWLQTWNDQWSKLILTYDISYVSYIMEILVVFSNSRFHGFRMVAYETLVNTDMTLFQSLEYKPPSLLFGL